MPLQSTCEKNKEDAVLYCKKRHQILHTFDVIDLPSLYSSGMPLFRRTLALMSSGWCEEALFSAISKKKGKTLF